MWNTAAVEMLMRLVEVEMLGIGRMGHRGLMGHRLVQDEKRMMVTRLVARLVMVVQSMGAGDETTGLGEARADPPAGYPSQSGRGPADRAGLPEGAAIARRQQLRREATAPIDVSRRGTLRAVSGGSRYRYGARAMRTSFLLASTPQKSKSALPAHTPLCACGRKL